MAVHFHPHARERMDKRNATEDEVKATIEQGEEFPAKFGRTGFRRNFQFTGERRGKLYKIKQIEACAVKEEGNWLVLTVITRYF